jgi:hypothetical protein
MNHHLLRNHEEVNAASLPYSYFLERSNDHNNFPDFCVKTLSLAKVELSTPLTNKPSSICRFFYGHVKQPLTTSKSRISMHAGLMHHYLDESKNSVLPSLVYILFINEYFSLRPILEFQTASTAM